MIAGRVLTLPYIIKLKNPIANGKAIVYNKEKNLREKYEAICTSHFLSAK